MGTLCSTVPTPALLQKLDKSVQTSDFLNSLQFTSNSSLSIENILTTNQQISKKLALSLCLSHIQNYRTDLAKSYFFIWHDSLLTTVLELPQTNEIELFQDEEFEINEHNIAEARDLINFENKITVRESPLFQYIEQVKKAEETPMALTSVFRFFEEMMDKKYEADVGNLAAGKQFVAVPDFFLDHLIRVYGLKKLAQKSMIQILITLKQLSEQGHRYGKILCQLLHIFDFNPIPNNLAYFLTKARFEMNKLNSTRKSIRIKRIEELHLVDAYNLAYSLLPNNRFARAKFISLIKPQVMTQEEFLIFRIESKIARLGQTPEQLFDSLDTDNKNKISIKDFFIYLNNSMEVLLHDTEIDVLNKAFNRVRSSKIPKAVFISKLTVKTSSEYLKEENLSIPKSNLLSCFVEVHHLVQLRDIAYFTYLFKSYKKHKLPLQDFSEILTKINPQFSQLSAQRLYEETLLQNSDCSLDGVLLDSFLRALQNHSIFPNDFYFEDNIEDKKDLRLLKRSSDVGVVEKKERPRRPSHLLDKNSHGLNRGFTPVDDKGLRTKSPAFGF